MKRLSKTIIFSLSFFIGFSQPAIEWETHLGGSQYESGNSVIENNWYNFVVCGVANSNDNDVSGNHSSASDFWVLRLNSDGTVKQKKCIGGSGFDDGQFVQATSDGGYIFLGTGSSNDGDMSFAWGGYDYWLVKTDTALNIQWEQNLGGTDFDSPFQVKELENGGYVVVGTTRSSDGDVTSIAGNSDYWIVKVDATGNIVWEKSYGGSNDDEAWAVTETQDNQLAVAGFSLSNDGDITNPKGNQDVWVIMLDSLGNLQWERSLGGASTDKAADIIQSWNGDLMVLAETGSVNGDISSNNGFVDYWLVRLSIDGDSLLWEDTYGGTGQDVPTSLIQTADSNFVMAGRAKSNNGDVGDNHGGEDFWIVQVDSVGDILWIKTMGGTSDDGAEFIMQTADLGYIISGYTSSSDGDISGTNNGIADYWIVKLEGTIEIIDTTGLAQNSIESNFYLYPNPAQNTMSVQIDNSLINTSIEITDISGRTLYSTNALKNNFDIDISHLQKGIYFMRLNIDGKATITKQFIKSN